MPQLRILLASLILSFLSIHPSHVQAKDPNDALSAAKTEMEDILSNLDTDIVKAKNKLKLVAEMDVTGQNEAVNEIFQGFKKRIIEALQGIDTNSELVDALQGAKEKAIRLQKWFSRQSPDYPHRDEYIARLQKALDDYNEKESKLNQQRTEALNTLSEIGAAHTRALMAVKVGKVEESVQAIQNVVNSLQKLNTSLRTIVNELDDSEANIPQSIAQ